MYNAPDLTVNMLMKIHTKLKPKELLPALMRCDEQKVTGSVHPVARFLEFVIASTPLFFFLIFVLIFDRGMH